MRDVLSVEATGGLSRAQGNSWQCGDTVDFLLIFIGLDIRREFVKSDCGDIVDLEVERTTKF